MKKNKGLRAVLYRARLTRKGPPAVIIKLERPFELRDITDKRFRRMQKNEASKDIYIRIGKNICDLRTRKKLSVKQLADKAGIKRPYLSNIENAKRHATLYILEKISKALGAELRDLIGLQVYFDGLSDKEFYATLAKKYGAIKRMTIEKM